MSLNDLSAQELARIDAICLQYESDLRKGNAVSLEEIVEQLGGENANVLRDELDAIRREVEGAINRSSSEVVTPFQVVTQEPGTEATRSKNMGVTEEIQFPKIGDHVGPYTLRSVIGHGGMGVVFQATDTRLDRDVAIKFLSVSGNQRNGLVERFEREAKAVASISHPNIVELFDVGVSNGHPYAVMELLKGQTLEKYVGQHQPTINEIRLIGSQIADALAVAHQKGIVHRDLKPQNVVVIATSDEKSRSKQSVSRFEIASGARGTVETANALVKVLDFGLSRVKSDPQNSDSDSDTKEGTILGTPGYMSPEQARGEPATTAADVFSFGCILHELFYCHPAFEGETPADRLAATLTGTPGVDSNRRAEDPALAELIAECLKRDPALRPQSAAQIATRLRQTSEPVDVVTSKINQGYASGEVLRRYFLMTICGGAVGSLVGASLMSSGPNELAQVKSLAVLSLDDGSRRDNTGFPIGDRDPTRAERFAGTLVHELTRLDHSIRVLPFRPLVAETPEQIKDLGKTLDVDAFVTGSARASKKAGNDILDVDLRIVSAATGAELDSFVHRFEDPDNVFQQTILASRIANSIGRRLTASSEKESFADPKTYNCLVDGNVRADVDSIEGLKKSLMCFEKAHEFDESYAEPLAGIALSSMRLAARSGREEAEKYCEVAKINLEKALRFDEDSVTAQLVEAMIDWQLLHNYEKAEAKLDELRMMHKYNWQVQHQHGLLALTTGQTDSAANALRDASRLHPMSLLIKTDRARAKWFDDAWQRALEDALHFAERSNSHVFAVGLAVDIYEQRGMYAEAAALDPSMGMGSEVSREQYFAARKERLIGLPYGPFGQLMNEAIWKLRSNPSDAERTSDFIEWENSQSPMFVLLLARHPAFAQMRELDRARDLLPK